MRKPRRTKGHHVSFLPAERIGDASRREQVALGCVLLIERHVGPVCPWPGTDVCEPHCSNQCSTTAQDAGAAPRTRPHGQGTPGGSSRSTAPHSHSARVSVAISGDHECRESEGGG